MKSLQTLDSTLVNILGPLNQAGDEWVVHLDTTSISRKGLGNVNPDWIEERIQWLYDDPVSIVLYNLGDTISGLAVANLSDDIARPFLGAGVYDYSNDALAITAIPGSNCVYLFNANAQSSSSVGVDRTNINFSNCWGFVPGVYYNTPGDGSWGCIVMGTKRGLKVYPT